jgi:hypothetical protein
VKNLVKEKDLPNTVMKELTYNELPFSFCAQCKHCDEKDHQVNSGRVARSYKVYYTLNCPPENLMEAKLEGYCRIWRTT